MVISWSSVYKIGKIVENFQFGVLETELSVPDDGLYPCSVGVMTSEKVEVGLSVLRGHEDVDDGVGAGAEIDQDVAQQEPEVVRGIADNLYNSYWEITDKKADKDDKNHLE